MIVIYMNISNNSNVPRAWMTNIRGAVDNSSYTLTIVVNIQCIAYTRFAFAICRDALSGHVMGLV